MSRKKQPPGWEHLARAKRAGIYHTDFTIDGRRVRESTGTTDLTEACAYASRRHAEERRGGAMPSRAPLTIAEAMARYLTENTSTYAETGQRYHVAAMAPHLHGMLADLDDEQVAQMIARLRDSGKGPATCNRHLATLSAVCKRAREVWKAPTGMWEARHHRQREPKGREVFLEYAQAQQLIAEIVPHARGPVLLDLLTGLRRGNVLGLSWEETSLDMGRLVLRTKGDRRHSVHLVPEAIALLASIQPDAGLRKGPVWRYRNPATDCRCPHCANPGNAGKPIRSVRTSFATAARKLGLNQRLRFHDIRHTVASWLLAEAGDLQLVREVLGHQDITTTARYAHLLPGRKEAAMRGAAASFLVEKHEVRKIA